MELYRADNMKAEISRVVIFRKTKCYFILEGSYLKWKKKGKFYSFSPTYSEAYNFLFNSINHE